MKQLCPKCNGQGIVSKPPHIPGDVNVWAASDTSYTCDVCNGEKLINSDDKGKLAGIMDKDTILNESIADAGNKLFLTARVLKAEQFIEGMYEMDGEVWKLTFTKVEPTITQQTAGETIA